MRLLASASNESLNVKGAYLEVWSDMLGSLGVIIAALIIRFTGWTWVDTIVAVAIGLWVLPRTWQLLRESLGILMEGVPRGLDVTAIEATIRGVARLGRQQWQQRDDVARSGTGFCRWGCCVGGRRGCCQRWI